MAREHATVFTIPLGRFRFESISGAERIGRD
jgi:hypothetical protein